MAAPVISIYKDSSGTTIESDPISKTGLEYNRADPTANFITVYIFNNRSNASGIADLIEPKLFVKNESQTGWVRAKTGPKTSTLEQYTVLGTDSDHGLSLGGTLSSNSYAEITFILNPSSEPQLNTQYSFEIWLSGSYT